MTFSDLTPTRWQAAEAKILAEQVLQNRFSEIYAKEYQRKDGSVFPVELRAFLVRDETGNPLAMWAIIRDISERRALDAQLLQHGKLESIGQLAAGIAHEINTPIQYIGDHARFLQDGLKWLGPMIQKYDEAMEASRAGKMPEPLAIEVTELRERADIEYFGAEAQKAVQQVLEGAGRVATSCAP